MQTLLVRTDPMGGSPMASAMYTNSWLGRGPYIKSNCSSTAWRNAWLDFNQTWQESSSGAGDFKGVQYTGGHHGGPGGGPHGPKLCKFACALLPLAHPAAMSWTRKVGHALTIYFKHHSYGERMTLFSWQYFRVAPMCPGIWGSRNFGEGALCTKVNFSFFDCWKVVHSFSNWWFSVPPTMYVAPPPKVAYVKSPQGVGGVLMGKPLKFCMSLLPLIQVITSL